MTLGGLIAFYHMRTSCIYQINKTTRQIHDFITAVCTYPVLSQRLYILIGQNQQIFWCTQSITIVLPQIKPLSKFRHVDVIQTLRTGATSSKSINKDMDKPFYLFLGESNTTNLMPPPQQPKRGTLLNLLSSTQMQTWSCLLCKIILGKPETYYHNLSNKEKLRSSNSIVCLCCSMQRSCSYPHTWQGKP